MDGIFAETFQACIDDGFMAFLPHTVHHEPCSRSYREVSSANANAACIRLSDILIHILHIAELGSVAGGARPKIEALGRSLATLAAMNDDLLSAMVDEWRGQILAKRLAFILHRLDATVEYAREVPSLRRDLVAQARAVASASHVRDAALADWPRADKPIGFRTVLGHLARGFLAWEDIWQAAVGLAMEDGEMGGCE
jgi:hypothetical protein